MSKILVLDNYDSFTYNLVHYVEKILDEDVDVHRNDKISLDEVNRYDKILLSPGPGIPEESGIMLDLIRMYHTTKSILGVCLGHQAIAEAFEGKLINLDTVYHGVATPINIMNGTDPLFRDIPKRIQAGRYHSWIVDKAALPDCFTINSEDEQGQIMGITHNQYDVRGVQFHPESVLTEHGLKMIENWLNYKPNR